MKIVCLGDLHLLWDKPIGRKDDAHKVQMDKVKFVLDWALNNKAIILQPGDFFDTARSWHLTSAYSEFFGNNLMTLLFAVYGQHDTYMYSEKTRHATGLGVLIANNLITLLGKEGKVFEDKTVIYGASFGQEVPKPKVGKDRLNILVIHKMIVGNEKLGFWQKDGDFVYAENFLDEQKDYDLIVCGDCHRRFLFEQDGRFIVNSGPLFRKEADMYNLTEASPGFYVYDTNEDVEDEMINWIDVPHEPANKVLSRNHIERQEEIDEAMEEFVSKMKINDDKITSVDFMSNLVAFLDNNKVEDGVKDILSEVMDEELK